MIAKPLPKRLEKRAQKAATAKLDREQNVLVKARSGGQCEVRTVDYGTPADKVSPNRVALVERCRRRAVHVHHLISGIGRRNVGASIQAACKLHVCEICHGDIHGHVLKPENELQRYHAVTVRYERAS